MAIDSLSLVVFKLFSTVYRTSWLVVLLKFIDVFKVSIFWIGEILDYYSLNELIWLRCLSPPVRV